MTRVAFAHTLQIPVITLLNLEHGRVRIDPAARTLFRILSHDPKHALEALQINRKAGGLLSFVTVYDIDLRLPSVML
jgi:hypothetical protein